MLASVLGNDRLAEPKLTRRVSKGSLGGRDSNPDSVVQSQK